MINTKSTKAIKAAAGKDDYFAAQNWRYITCKVRGWNDMAIEQFMTDYCEFCKEIEILKDDFDLTYSEIVEILLESKE